MPNFYVYNISNPKPHSPEYPGTRVDIPGNDPREAEKTYIADPANGAMPTHRFRTIAGAVITWGEAIAQPPTSVAASAPTLPPVGG